MKIIYLLGYYAAKITCLFFLCKFYANKNDYKINIYDFLVTKGY